MGKRLKKMATPKAKSAKALERQLTSQKGGKDKIKRN